jgi:hypothetical protein
MPIVNKGKVLETFAAMSFYHQGGGRGAALAFGRWAAAWGLPWAPTDEETARRRKSILYMDGHRINNGRGERLFDAATISGVPISLKAGDSRDITLWKQGEKGIVRLFVEAGAPIWCYRISAPKGAVRDFRYEEGEEAHIPAPDLNLVTMRRIDIRPVILDNLRSWERTEEDGVMVRVRKDDRTNNGTVYHYDRLNINFRLVPDRYWLDKEPVKFDAYAPLPSPFKVG